MRISDTHTHTHTLNEKERERERERERETEDTKDHIQREKRMINTQHYEREWQKEDRHTDKWKESSR